MQQQYNIGDTVRVTGNTPNEAYAWHQLPTGAICWIKQVGENGFYVLETNLGTREVLHVRDFRPAFDEARALRDDEQSFTENSF